MLNDERDIRIIWCCNGKKNSQTCKIKKYAQFKDKSLGPNKLFTLNELNKAIYIQVIILIENNNIIKMNNNNNNNKLITKIIKKNNNDDLISNDVPNWYLSAFVDKNGNRLTYKLNQSRIGYFIEKFSQFTKQKNYLNDKICDDLNDFGTQLQTLKDFFILQTSDNLKHLMKVVAKSMNKHDLNYFYKYYGLIRALFVGFKSKYKRYDAVWYQILYHHNTLKNQPLLFPKSLCWSGHCEEIKIKNTFF